MVNAMSTAKGTNNTDRLAVQRQLRIKVGATKRLFKEHNLYKKEADDHQRKLDRMITESGEEWDTKNARRIFEESQRMIKDTGDRLEKVVQELSTLIDAVKSRPEFSGDQELLEAENAFTEASGVLQADKAL